MLLRRGVMGEPSDRRSKWDMVPFTEQVSTLFRGGSADSDR